MAKKIRLIDDDSETATAETATSVSNFSAEDVEKAMKFLEAIDWKLWELLKLARADAEK